MFDYGIVNTTIFLLSKRIQAKVRIFLVLLLNLFCFLFEDVDARSTHHPSRFENGAR
jgi:hypothetical protein